MSETYLEVPKSEQLEPGLGVWLRGTSFWRPDYLESSAWLDHAPFAFWIVNALKPGMLVELGTHGGYSYFAFCQAVKHLNLPTHCYAVDTWKGDEHAGYYGEEVYERVRSHNELNYAAFSRLVRATFDEALEQFSDGSIDLLHVDGRHFYEDVKHDFEAWRPKLSDRAVVLFHDTNVRERNFGVWQLWEELKSAYPAFEFLHGHGLGVLGFGSDLPKEVSQFLKAAGDSSSANEIRQAYSRLGGAVRLELMHRNLKEAMGRQEARAAELIEKLRARDGEKRELAAKLREQEAKTEALAKKVETREERARELMAKLQAREAEAQDLNRKLRALEAEHRDVSTQLKLEVVRTRELTAKLQAKAAEAQQAQAGVRAREGELVRMRNQVAQLEVRNRKLTERLEILAAEKKELLTDLRVREGELEKLFTSTSWKIMQPLRALAKKSPKAANAAGLGLRLAWWTATLRVHEEAPKRLRERKKFLQEYEAISKSGLFDSDYYIADNPDVARSEQDPLNHYLHVGAAMGLDPHPLFDTDWYLELNPDVRESGFNPLAHFIIAGAAEGRDPHPLFDSSWYLERNRDVAEAGINPLAHYVSVGAQEGRDPNPLFDSDWYLSQNEDVAETGVNPLVHYLTSGAAEGRNPHPLFASEWYIAQNSDVAEAESNPLAHYLWNGAAEGRDPHPLFDSDWYLHQYGDVAEAGVNPLAHYLDPGWAEGRDPNPHFDTDWYIKRNSDLGEMNPLIHYLLHGAAEGRDPHPLFDSKYYLSRNRDVAESEVNPLAHFLRFGKSEGRIPHSLLEKPLTKPDETGKSAFQLQLPEPLAPFEAWQFYNRHSERRRNAIRDAVAGLKRPIVFSVLMPVYDPPEDALRQAIESVLRQTYAGWEFIIVDDRSTNPVIGEVLAEYEARDSRIKVLYRETNGHISAATNTAAEAATGEYYVLLDNDDMLDEEALALFAIQAGAEPDADIIYSDDAKILEDEESNRWGLSLYAPKLKPDWSPELLYSYCYVSHLKAIRASLYRELGGCRVGFEGSQDHDLLLRASERARRIAHVPQVLYRRRVLSTSTAATGNAKPYSFEAGRKAVEEALIRRGVSCSVIHPEWAVRAGAGYYVPQFPDEGPSVAIIIPSRNNWSVLDRLIQSLGKTSYKNYKIYVLDNESDEPETVEYLIKCDETVLHIGNPNGRFNFAYINNQAVNSVQEEYVLFLNDDTEVTHSEWLSQMVGWAKIPGVGAVGARLLYPDGRVQHGGVTLGLRQGLTMFRGLRAGSGGYLAHARVTRNTIAVTAACLLTPRKLFLDLGGYDAENFGVAYNDVDYCVRLHDRGHRIVYCGEAELIHHEGYSRGKVDDPREVAEMVRRYSARRDPYFSRHFSKDHNDCTIKPTVVPVVEASPGPRVLALTHNLNHEGAPNSQFEMISGLARRGDVHPVVISPVDGPLRAEYESAGIEVIVERGISPMRQGTSLEKYLECTERIMNIARSRRSEVIYANTILGFPAIDAAHMAGIPSVWNIRESDGWETHLGRLPEEVISRALSSFGHPYRVIFVAEATRRAWRQFDWMHNFELIHNGLDRERFERKVAGIDRQEARARLGLNPNDVVFLSLGALCARKGQLDLVEAMSLLPERSAADIHVYLVGASENDYTALVKARLAELPEEKCRRIQLIPATGETGLYWCAADVFCLTSRNESYPRVVLEAMALGLPIIATPVFGVKEQVTEEVNAFFYPPGEPEQLATAIQKLAEDPARRRMMAAASLDVFAALTSYDRMLDQYSDIFKAAAESSVPPARRVGIRRRREASEAVGAAS